MSGFHPKEDHPNHWSQHRPRSGSRPACGYFGCSTVILGVRTLSKGEEAKSDIESSTGRSNAKVIVWPIDLESFASVQAFAGEVQNYVAGEGGRLDMAIMNAGIASVEYAKTSDGWERGIQVNVLSTALLSLQLLPLLLQTRTRHPSSRPHLTILTSDIMKSIKFPERHDGNILRVLNEQDQWAKFQKAGGATERYGVTKLMDFFITIELARLIPRDDSGDPLVVVNAVAPGFCKSSLLTREKAPLILKVVQAVIARTVEEGSKTLLHAVAQGVETHGKWLEKQVVTDPGSIGTDAEAVEVKGKVWQEIIAVLRDIDPELRTDRDNSIIHESSPDGFLGCPPNGLQTVGSAAAARTRRGNLHPNQAHGIICYVKLQEKISITQTQSKELAKSTILPDNADLEALATRNWYRQFTKVGLNYGPSFQALKEIKTPRAKSGKHLLAKTQLLQGGGGGKEAQSTYLVHPITIDVMLQAGITASTSGIIKDLGANVPVSIEEAYFHAPEAPPKVPYSNDAGARTFGFSAFMLNACLYDNQDHPCVILKDVADEEEREPILRVLWKPDVTTLSSDGLANYLSTSSNVDRIDSTKAVSKFGMDGMLAAEFRTWFYQAFKIDVPFLALSSETTTLTVLGEMVHESVIKT
ncbi:hypothetical protein BJ170DRAFT_734047 [Xylariales sp. AK1849]|nr:hypothetical protein BJ170DRAFT_734047 [Xylariales sp. AK1849]